MCRTHFFLILLGPWIYIHSRPPFGPPFHTLFDHLFDQDVHRFDRKAPEKALKRGSFLRPLFGPPSELQNERGPTWELGGGPPLLLPSQPLKPVEAKLTGKSMELCGVCCVSSITQKHI